MSDRINLYLHGELEAIANHLGSDYPDHLDDVDTRALLTNICSRLDRVITWSESESVRLESQIERITERLEGAIERLQERIDA